MTTVGWVTTPGSFGWNKHSGSPGRFERRPIWWWFCDIWPWGGTTIWWVEVDGLWNTWMVLDWCVLWDPTFMLGIWQRGEWLKKDLAQPFYVRVERGSPILGLDFESSIWGYFSLYFYEYYTALYVDYMAMISLVFMLLLCWLCMCFMTTNMYGSKHVFTCIWMDNVSIT